MRCLLTSFTLALFLPATAAAPAAAPAAGAPLGEPAPLTGVEREAAEVAARRAEELAAESQRFAVLAAQAADQAASLRQTLLDATREATAHARAQAARSAQMAQLRRDAARAEANLERGEAAIFDAYASLQHVSLRGGDRRLARDGATHADAYRAGLILAAVTPAIKRDRDMAEAELDAILASREALTTNTAPGASPNLRRRADLEAQIAEALANEAEAARRAAALASEADAAKAQADALAAIVASLEDRADAGRPRRKPAPAPVIAPAAPLAPSPVPDVSEDPVAEALLVADAGPALDLRGPSGDAARLVAQYGKDERAGRRHGIVYETQPAALVVSPVDATIIWEGVLRGYGRVLILDAGEGYHFVLAGLSAVYGGAGETVSAGEPVGTMPQGRVGAPELYVELRRDGTPIDPTPRLRG